MTDLLSFEFIRLILQYWIRTLELNIAENFKEVQNTYKVEMEYSLERFYNRLLEAEKSRDKADREQLVQDVDYEEIINNINDEIEKAKENHPLIEFEIRLQEIKYKNWNTIFKWIIGDKVVDEFNKNRTILSDYNIKFLNERDVIQKEAKKITFSSL